MENIKYTIITPNYNSFELMKKYFEKLEAQVYKNFEVIIIDDASTDNSLEKLQEYKEKTNLNLRIYQNEKNTGPGMARNYGINKANGEWITFIDNDDWVDETLLEEIDRVIKNDIDCVIYDYCIENNKKLSNMASIYGKKQGMIDTSTAVAYTRNHSVCKFYKTEILKKNNVYYPNIKRHEDIAFVAQALSYCKKIYYLKKPLYHYVQRNNSLSNKVELDETTLIEAFNILENKIGNKYKNELEIKSVTDLLYGTCIIMCKAGKRNDEIKKYIMKYEKKYPNWYNSPIILTLGKGKKIFLYAIKHKFIFVMKFISKIHSLIVKG